MLTLGVSIFNFTSSKISFWKTIEPQNLLKKQKSIAVERQKVGFNLKKGRSTVFSFCKLSKAITFEI
jgi:hypothetical protein